MKISVTSVVTTTFEPEVVESLTMSSSGFPLVNGEPQDLSANTIYNLSGKFMTYLGGDDWEEATDGEDYNNQKHLLKSILDKEN